LLAAGEALPRLQLEIDRHFPCFIGAAFVPANPYLVFAVLAGGGFLVLVEVGGIEVKAVDGIPGEFAVRPADLPE